MATESAKRKYLVVHPKHAMRVKLDDDDEAKVQNLPIGSEVNLIPAHASSAVASGKLKLVTAKTKVVSQPAADPESKD